MSLGGPLQELLDEGAQASEVRRPPARRAVRHSRSWRLRDRLPTCSRRHRPAPACPSRRASGGGCLKNLLLPRGTSPSSGWPAGLALPALPTTLAPLVGLLQEGGAGRTVGTPRLPTPGHRGPGGALGDGEERCEAGRTEGATGRPAQSPWWRSTYPFDLIVTTTSKAARPSGTSSSEREPSTQNSCNASPRTRTIIEPIVAYSLTNGPVVQPGRATVQPPSSVFARSSCEWS